MGLKTKLRKPKILFVDGDEWIRDSLSLFFEGEWCQFLAFETGEEALNALRGQDFDIVITDYRLPDMDGLELFRLVRASHYDIMKILVTTYGDSDLVSEAARIGIHGFIEKPFKAADLSYKLRHIAETTSLRSLRQNG
ncbi:MAG: response regulator [Thermodesulfobacteriota bacterium]|nr:response regulator [Thermodesulfobacteriota bacterium]